MTTLTTINWQTDSLNVIRAKQELAKFHESNEEIKGKGYTRVEEYNARRISELESIIN